MDISGRWIPIIRVEIVTEGRGVGYQVDISGRWVPIIRVKIVDSFGVRLRTILITLMFRQSTMMFYSFK